MNWVEVEVDLIREFFFFLTDLQELNNSPDGFFLEILNLMPYSHLEKTIFFLLFSVCFAIHGRMLVVGLPNLLTSVANLCPQFSVFNLSTYSTVSL